MSFLNAERFHVIAGEEVVNRIRAARSSLQRNERGIDSETLVEQQERQAGEGIVGVEIVKSIRGQSVRYDSGLQDFGLVASSKQLGGSLEAAEEFCRRWVAADPEHRYAWRRK